MENQGSATMEETGSEGMCGSEGLPLSSKTSKDQQWSPVGIWAGSKTGTKRIPLNIPSFDSYLDMGMKFSGPRLPLLVLEPIG